MTDKRTAKERFTDAVMELLKLGVYPSPNAILKIYLRDPTTKRHMLNGDQCKWRKEILLSEGWTRHPDARPEVWRGEEYKLGTKYPRYSWVRP